MRYLSPDGGVSFTRQYVKLEGEKIIIALTSFGILKKNVLYRRDVDAEGHFWTTPMTTIKKAKDEVFTALLLLLSLFVYEVHKPKYTVIRDNSVTSHHIACILTVSKCRDIRRGM